MEQEGRNAPKKAEELSYSNSNSLGSHIGPDRYSNLCTIYFVELLNGCFESSSYLYLYGLAGSEEAQASSP